MLLVRRPRTPRGFNRAAQAARTKIRDMIGRGEHPKAEDFDNKWSDFKHVLAEAQGGRCGYCDRSVLGGDDGTIDHYRPKTEICGLFADPSTWGTQKAHSASVEGRLTDELSERGYHWLAYAWNNYVFACSCCNAKWKRAFFPVEVHPRCCPPRPKSHEEPMLMNCYRVLRPSDHLQFNDDGTVEARDGSRYGYETIRTVGLYRDPLCNERRDIAQRVYELIQEIVDGDQAQERTAACHLRAMGGEEKPWFPGVVRAIVEQRFEMSWEEFIAVFAAG